VHSEHNQNSEKGYLINSHIGHKKGRGARKHNHNHRLFVYFINEVHLFTGVTAAGMRESLEKGKHKFSESKDDGKV
jgi:hypothetical protein